MPSKLNIDETLRQGATGPKVKQLQDILEAIGIDVGTPDGIFGAGTVSAVKQFQSKKGMEADGAVGKGTQEALNKALDQISSSSSSASSGSMKGFGGTTGKLPLPAIPLVKEFEGCYLDAYVDPQSGNLPITIGFGCTKKRDGSNWKLGDKITKQEAEDLLMSQIENQYLPILQKRIPDWDKLNANQQGALLSFGYNLGPNFYGSDGFESMTRVLKNKSWDEMEETFLKYRSPGTSVEAGLKRRRQAEANLFLAKS
ncbi:MAG: peptidoglycan-binding protein [Nostocales cyanobacterium ELA583]|jgi:lysozyme